MTQGAQHYGFGPFRLDPANAVLWFGDDRIALQPKPFEILCCLVRRAGELVTKDEILDAVWPGIHVSQSSLTFSVNALRSALGDDARSPKYVETVPRRGYRFIAPVSTGEHDEEARKPDETHTAPWWEKQSRGWCVGRAAQLDMLEQHLVKAVSGDRQVAFVTGAAGIGKTTLVHMLVETVSRRGIAVLWGSCVENFGASEAFLPLIEAVQEACSGPYGPSIRDALRKHAPTWLSQMPRYLDENDKAELPRELFGASRERMLREFCELFEALSEVRPWVVVIEDLHWSDFATLDVLSLFARRRQRAAVLVLVTLRPGDVPSGNHPARVVQHDLQSRGNGTEIALDRLCGPEVEEYLALRFGSAEIGKALGPTVFQRTAGHPLFVTSFVDYLISRNAIEDLDGTWHVGELASASTAIPSDLSQMITYQVDRLDARDQVLLEAASVVGPEFSAASVASAVDRDVVDVERDCERLTRIGRILCTAGEAEWADGTFAGRYEFSHALYQEVLYRRLTPARRTDLHRRIAERLEAAYVDHASEIAATLASHFEEGRDFAKAIAYLRQAADLATKRFTHREAALHLTRALSLTDRLPSDTRADLRIRLLQSRAWARRSAGERQGVLDDFAAVVSCARNANRPLVEIEALLDFSRYCLFVDRRRCLEIAERACARSRELGDEFMKALSNANRANLNFYLKGFHADDVELCRRAGELLADSTDPFIVMRCHRIENTIAVVTADYDRAYGGSERGMELARANGDLFTYVLFSVFGAISLLHLGRWGELRHHLTEALTITEKNESAQLTCPFKLLLAWLHAEAADFGGARKLCSDVLTPEVEENPFSFFFGRIVSAKSSLGLDDPATASKDLAAIRRKIEIDDIPIESYFYPLFCHTNCEYLLAIGELDRARIEASHLEDVAAGPPERTYLALSHRLSAMIAMAEGELDRAHHQLERAVAICEAYEVPLAAWRIYATATTFHEAAGERERAARFRSRSEHAVRTLADTLDMDDPLRASLVAGSLRLLAEPIAALGRAQPIPMTCR